nr:CASP8 and FADD-like apoptosis regulator [Nerophis lumbriciformis]
MHCVIQQISESLGSIERAKVFYLCEILDTDNTAVRVKETLTSKVMSYDADSLFLAELMLHLRRYDILRKVLGSSKDEVERALGSRQVLPRFRVLMAHISEDMTNDDIKSVKFLLSDMLPREKIESAKNFLDVIIELEKLGKISPKRVDFLEECLRIVGRIDLAKKLKMFKMSVNLPTTEEVVHHACQNPVNRYTFTSEPRGVCLIIDCVGNDGEMLEHTFKSLNFDVTLHKWLGLIETVTTLKSVFRGGSDHRGDGHVCCIVSRATDNHLLATDSDCEGLRLQDVRRLFTGAGCSALVGKPKLFFVQSYTVPALQPFVGGNYWDDEQLETDGGGGQLQTDSTPFDADVLWSHCRTGEQQLQEGQHHSVYLKALTGALSGCQRRSRHVIDLHEEVDKVIMEHNSRHPGAEYHIDLKNTLTKNLYL